MSALNKWHTLQINFVLSLPHALVEREIYMEIPKGFQIKEGNTKDRVLNLHGNVYSQKQAGEVWYKYLTNILINKVSFKHSKVDKCVFYRGNVMYVLYTDESILACPDTKDIDLAIEYIKLAKPNITDEGGIQELPGVNIDCKPDGTIHLNQPHLIDQTLDDLKMREKTKPKDTLDSISKILLRHTNSEYFEQSFNY